MVAIHFPVWEITRCFSGVVCQLFMSLEMAKSLPQHVQSPKLRVWFDFVLNVNNKNLFLFAEFGITYYRIIFLLKNIIIYGCEIFF
jgi:hypothetical protein